MQKRARKCYLWGSNKDKVKEGIKIHSALRARRARAASEASPPQIPGRAAENFFLRVHFHKRKKFRGRRFQDRSKICTRTNERTNGRTDERTHALMYTLTRGVEVGIPARVGRFSKFKNCKYFSKKAHLHSIEWSVKKRPFC